MIAFGARGLTGRLAPYRFSDTGRLAPYRFSDTGRHAPYRFSDTGRLAPCTALVAPVGSRRTAFGSRYEHAMLASVSLLMKTL